MSATSATTTKSAHPSAQALIQGHLFNPETDTKYAKCKTNASGGKSVGIYNSQTGQSLFVGTPLLMTWGLQKYEDEKTGKVSYEFSLQFPNDDFDTEDTRAFLQSMIAFERKLKADALTNSKEWFAKPKMTPDAVEALFTPILKYPMDKVTCEKDMSKKPTMRIKVPFWEGKWEGVEIYDGDRNRLFPSSDPNVSPMDIITKLSHMKAMIQCGGIWFANGKFGITWRFVQSMIQPRLSMRGKCHLSFDSASSTVAGAIGSGVALEKRIEDDHHEHEVVHAPKQPQFTAETVDSEEDDGDHSDGDDEEEDAPLSRTASAAPVKPAPPPPVVASSDQTAAPKKKIVKKVGAA